MSSEDWRAIATLAAAFVTGLFGLWQFYLLKRKEIDFELSKRSLEAKRTEDQRAHEKELEEKKYEYERLVLQKKFAHEREIIKIRSNADAWKVMQETAIAARISEFRHLQNAVIHLFDSFKSLLRIARTLEDDDVIEALGRCIAAMAKLDEAIVRASAVVSHERDTAKLNRLKVMRKFFLLLILSLARKKAERLRQAAIIDQLASRLERRRDIAIRHVGIIVRHVSNPPWDNDPKAVEAPNGTGL